MGNIKHLLNKTIVIKRLEDDGTDTSILATVTSGKGHIQPGMNSSRQIENGVFGKQFKIYTDPSLDVNPGDTIRDSDNNEYEVMSDGVTERTFGSITYQIILAEKL